MKKSQTSLRRLNLTIRNLHCPSCVRIITDSLNKLSLTDVYVSLVNQVVSINFSSDDDLPYIIIETLQDQGFQITNATIRNPSQDSSYSEPALLVNTNRSLKCSIKHEDYCEACRNNDQDLEPIEKSKTLMHKVIVALPDITCSSCVKTVTSALNLVDGIKDINIDLIRKQVSFNCEINKDETEAIAAIEEAGYSAKLSSISSVANGDEMYQYKVYIDGMHCASCTKKIKLKFESIKEFYNVSIDLLTSLGIFVGLSSGLESIILETLRNIGYSGKIISIDRISTVKGQKDSTTRKVQIMIEGMHCFQCPPKVISSIEKLGSNIEYTSNLELDNPILTISYHPDPPNFTLRTIFNAIEELNFCPSYYTPPSAEEVSQQVQKAEQRQLLHSIMICGFISVPTIFLGIIVMTVLPRDNFLTRFFMNPVIGKLNLLTIALFILATPVQFYVGIGFHKRALSGIYRLWKRNSRVSIKDRLLRFGSMDLLISAGISVAYFASLISGIDSIMKDYDGVMNSLAPTYFDSTVLLTFFVLLGRYLEAKSKLKTAKAATMLKNLQPSSSYLLPDNKYISTNLVEVNDTVRIFSGAKASVDGIIISGDTTLDESSISGESMPVYKSTGDEIFAGTINLGKPIDLKVRNIVENTFLSKIIEVVNEGQRKQSPIEKLADSITSYFVPFVTMLAILTWLSWTIIGYSGLINEDILKVKNPNWVFWALKYSIAVFVVACPCGIGLAAPTACFVGTSISAKYGILAQGGGDSFQTASEISSIVFDKTGTLTNGSDPEVTAHILSENHNRDMLISSIYEIETTSSHPLACSISKFLKVNYRDDLRPLKLEDVKEIAGRGLEAKFLYNEVKYQILVGNASWIKEGDSNNDVLIWESQRRAWMEKGNSIVIVAIRAIKSEDESLELVGQFGVRDKIRPEAKNLIMKLKKQNYDIWMMTGDNSITAKAIATELSINETNVISEVKPNEKAEYVKRIQLTANSKRKYWKHFFSRRNKRNVVAFVGDGINDAPALTVADIGIAIGSGSDIAMNSSEFIIVHSDLRSIYVLLDLSRTVYERVLFNFGWAMVYNIIGIPLAAGALLPLGLTLEPVWASIAMALSSISVVLSSFMLNLYKPPKLD